MESCKNFHLIRSRAWEIGIIVLAIIITPIVSLMSAPFFLFALVQREILKWYLHSQHENRYKVMSPLDSVSSLETPPKVVGYTTCLLVETLEPFDEKKLINMRAKISTMLNTQIYRKLKYRQCTKWGYNCWEDMGLEMDGFNISNHVNLCPGMDDCKKIYSETDLMTAIKDRVNLDLDAQTKPAWEVLVVPQVKMKSGASKSTFKQQLALIIRINHGYMDARSFKEFLKRCLFDGEISFLPVVKKSGGIQRAGVGLSCISVLYSIVFNIRDSLCHPKLVISTTGLSDSYRLAYIKVDGSTMSRIRASFKSETLAVFGSALLAALKELAYGKKYILPSSLNVALTTTVDHQPASDEPGNLFNVYSRFLSIKETNPDANLKAINEQILLSPTDSLELLGNFGLFVLFGHLPNIWIRTFLKYFEFRSIGLTTLPMSEQIFKFQGGQVTSLFTTLRPVLGVAFSLTTVYYRGKFHVGISANDNQLIKDYHDMGEFVQHFQRHVQRLASLSLLRCNMSRGQQLNAFN